MLTSTVYDFATSSLTCWITACRKPGADTVSRYVPGGIATNVYWPESFVNVERVTPVAGSTSVTLALATTAPLGSVTDPTTVAVAAVWPHTGIAPVASSPSRAARIMCCLFMLHPLFSGPKPARMNCASFQAQSPNKLNVCNLYGKPDSSSRQTNCEMRLAAEKRPAPIPDFRRTRARGNGTEGQVRQTRAHLQPKLRLPPPETLSPLDARSLPQTPRLL